MVHLRCYADEVYTTGNFENEEIKWTLIRWCKTQRKTVIKF